jgi:TetR/AcrR family transcriptional regulator
MVMARGSEASASRGQILAAAARQFAARGFEATSLQQIADELGLTKQAVLHHFRTKDQLRQAVFDDILGHWRDALPRLLFAATASEDRFDAVFGELHRFFSAAPDRARLLIREALDRPAEVKRLLRGPVRPWVQAVASYVRQGQGSGRHFADADPEAYVALITLFVISAISSAELAQASLTGVADGDLSKRWDGELKRIAKSSLFTPRAEPAAAKTPRSKKPRAPRTAVTRSRARTGTPR